MKFEEAEGDRSDDSLAPTQCTTLLSNMEPYMSTRQSSNILYFGWASLPLSHPSFPLTGK